MRARHGILLALSALALAGCGAAFHPKSANPYEPDRGPASGGSGEVGVGLGPAAAVAASVARRIDGECYVPCLKGTICNRETGLCDALPCRGECKAGEYCEERGLVDRCVPEPSPLLQIEVKARAREPAPAAKLPADAPRDEGPAAEPAPP